MSMAQFLALLLCAFCLAALLLGLYRPAWVLPSRRATRMQVLVLYSAVAVIGPQVAGELAHRTAHAQGSGAGSVETAGSSQLGAADAGGSHNLHLNEQEPEPESLRDLASRVLLDLGLGAGHRLRIGRLTMVYEAPVTEAQAVALGEFLSRSEVVSDRSASSGSSRYGQVQVQLRRSSPNSTNSTNSTNSPTSPGSSAAVNNSNSNSNSPAQDAYEIRIATPFSHRQELDPETKAAYQMVGLLASGIAFDGAPVHIQICTNLLRPLLVLRPQLGAAVPAPPSEP